MEWNDIFNKLPIELHKVIYDFMPILERQFNIDYWANMIIAGDYAGAYRFLTANMTSAELVAEQARIKAVIKGLNQENAQAVDVERQTMRDLFKAIVLIAVASATDS